MRCTTTVPRSRRLTPRRAWLPALLWPALVCAQAESAESQPWQRGRLTVAAHGFVERPTTELRIIEMPMLADPARPYDRPPRALEVPAYQTTAFVRDMGLPVTSCVNRLRMPSKISDKGDISLKLQWFLACRF